MGKPGLIVGAGGGGDVGTRRESSDGRWKV